jgi:FkbM family methyltransferase
MFRKFFARLDKRHRAKTADRLRSVFFDLQEEIRPDLFVEVGAYDAITSIHMRSILPAARIVAFEANPSNHKHFSESPDYDYASEMVEYVASAVSDVVGQKTFKMMGRNDLGLSKKSSLLNRTDASRKYEDVEVPCTTLDSYFSDSHHKTSSLWIDVEGASREVLKGASRVLDTAQSVLIEVEDIQYWQGQWLAADVISFMEGRGFRQAGRDFEYAHQYNILFARA